MIAYFDMFSGISGDMTLGAFVDLGVPLDWLEEKLSRVLSGFSLKANRVYRHHLRATDLIVDISNQDRSSRNYTDIKTLIKNSALSENVKKNSLTAFKKIAEAESDIHGKDIETVHFHEVGGVDSIVDVVGSFLCVEYLGIKKIYASCVPLGSGVVACSHGQIPVPVPATVEILKNIPVKPSDAGTEIVTPTGAAIVTTLAASFGAVPEMMIKQVGYGAGKRETGSRLPNLLRIILGSEMDGPAKDAAALKKEMIHVIKTNVDDMSPESFGFLMEVLFENKAMDVCYIPVQMKKNRPGIQIEVLCRKKDIDPIIHTLLSHTTSIGVRYHECERSFLSREKAIVRTSFGNVKMKKIISPDKTVRFVPEYEEARRVALKINKPFNDVYHQMLSEANPLGSDPD